MAVKTTTLTAAIIALSLAALGERAEAAPEDDIAALRRELEALRQGYENRIRNLEDRLQRAETERTAKAAAPAAAATAAASPGAAAAPAPRSAPSQPAAASAFNPAVSAVLNGTYGRFSRDPDAARIPGFVKGPEDSPGTRGFSLGESEVNLSANIDSFLYGSLTVAYASDDSVAVEEAYVRTTSLPYGLTAKGGRFFSGIGYLNERHAHEWDFIDQPLPYRALLDGQYGDDGVQIRWIAPTDFFLEFGGELFRGDSFPAGNASRDGVGAQSVFVHAGDDFDDSSSWLAGLSWLQTRARNRETESDFVTGRDDLGIASMVYKWAPDGNPIDRNLIVAGEAFFRRSTGSFNETDFNTDQIGWYVQAVYQFMRGWRTGLRYDRLDAGDPGAAFAGTALDPQDHRPRRVTGLLEYDTSEFGRFRLQYSRDDADVETDNAVQLQYTVTFGPHGAHRF